MSLSSFFPPLRDARFCLSSSGSLGRHFPAFKVICKTATAGSPFQVARFLHLLPDTDAADPVFVFPCGLATKAGLLPTGCAGTFLVFPGWCPETANTNSARRQPALPSSRVTPSNACPALGPRWCPVGLPVLRCATRLIRSDNTSRTAVFQFAQTVGFGPDASCPGYPYGPRLYKFRGAITRPAFSLARLHTQ